MTFGKGSALPRRRNRLFTRINGYWIFSRFSGGQDNVPHNSYQYECVMKAAAKCMLYQGYRTGICRPALYAGVSPGTDNAA